MTKRTSISALLAVLWIAPAGAAVPARVDFQGLLLDANGDPVNGQVDLAFTLYDALSGGNLLWTESHTDVDVIDGIYDVDLGSLTPLTQAVLAGGDVFLEVSVDGETLAPRQQLLAVPYALRAAQAEDAGNVGGLSSLFVTELFEHFAFDGADPPNDDPSEGLADTDGDGLANFIDPDNDGDGLGDAAELAQGSDINLVTPRITGFAPEPAEATVSSTVQVQGDQFAPGLGVVFGSETPAPANVTSTSFEVQVGPQPEGTVGVTVTLPNGETASDSFTFQRLPPVIDSIVPGAAQTGTTTLVTVNGQRFLPGTTVAFGSQNPAPQDLTPTSFQVEVGPQPAATVSVVVTSGNGLSDTAGFTFRDAITVFATDAATDGDLGGLAGADALCTAAASAAGLTGGYVAWLSDDVEDARDRISQSPGVSYALPGGETVADDFADLTDGSLDHPIDQRADGSAVAPAARAWTGSLADGTAFPGSSCGGWTLGSGPQGRQGETDSATASWSNAISVVCENAGLLYCFGP